VIPPSVAETRPPAPAELDLIRGTLDPGRHRDAELG
jgi:hypothetical protein